MGMQTVHERMRCAPMLVSFIAAMGENRVIGAHNRLPWRLPADLRRFREITMGKPVVMGRKTFESIGRPLPGRMNIVVTRNPAYCAEGCTVVQSIEESLAACEGQAKEVMVIGGSSLYAQMLPWARRMYLTLIHHSFSGDAFFPAFDMDEWRETDRRVFPANTDNPFAYSFLVLDRN